MSIKTDLKHLNEMDIWSLMLFSLYSVKDAPEYSGLSELAYILDKKNLLKLCEYFGGQTITIPTIDQLELLLYGLLMYQYIHVEGMTYEDAFEIVNPPQYSHNDIRYSYNRIVTTLENYEFTSRGRI